MVDIHQPGDYPILLGDSLKDDASPSSSHISLRYNWIPRSGLENNKGKIKVTPDGVSLAYDRNGEALKYTGWIAERSDADQNPQLALFYDSSKSAFVVERLAATLDFNLHSGTNITPDHINRHSQIVKPGGTSTDPNSQNPNGDRSDNDSDESPDKSNPFDYRHFLTEAKEAAEKASLAGNRTPLPGGHTPMSGLSSPMGGSHLLQSSTPQFGPVEIIDATHIEDGPEWGDRRHHFKSATKNKTVRKTKAATTTRAKPKTSATSKQQSQPKPLSSERVQSSDSDSDSDTQPAPPVPTPKPKQTKKTPPKKKTQPPPRSPAIIVDNENDSDSGGLEIQSGSPPPSTLRKRGYKIDADAFRSQSGTPAITRPVSSQSNADMDVDMPDADADDADGDIDDEYNKYLASDSDEEMSNTRRPTNADVDDLILDDGSTSSPEPAPVPAPAPAPSRVPAKPAPAPAPREDPPIVQAPIAQRAKRRQSSTISRASRASRAPTRTSTLDKTRQTVRSPSPTAEDSDDDGGLAKELEEALLREEYGYGDEDEEDESGVGLGIEVRGGVDEESDISEEE